MKKGRLLIALVFILALFFRLYKFNQVPAGFHFDEASFGYNAWSILETGRDEFGTRFPTNFRSFDDYRPPTYIYLTSLVMFFLGPTDLAVRMVALLSGLGIVWLIYKLGTGFFNHKVGLWAAFLTALNPALILVSRAAHDANLALFLTLLAIWLFFQSLSKKNYFYYLSSLLTAALAIISYQSSKVFVPALFLVLHALYFKRVRSAINSFPKLIFLIFWGLVALGIIGKICFSPEALSRFSTISVFNNDQILTVSANRNLYLKNRHFPFSPFLANRYLLILADSVGHYLDCFSLTYLFAPRVFASQYIVPNFNSFHLFDLLLLSVGLFVVIKKKGDIRLKYFLIGWLVLTPLPVVFINDAPKITRLLPLIPLFLIVGGLGADRIWKRKKIMLAAPYLLTTGLFFLSFFNVFNFESAYYWQTGYREMVDKVLRHYDQSDKIYVSNSLQLPYIYFLWYGKFDPKEYLSQGGTTTGNILAADNRIGKLVFHGLTKEVLKQATGETLLVGYPEDFQNLATKEGVQDVGEVVEKVGCQDKEECFWLVKK